MNVSVIIAAHNAAQTITETLESIRAQTFPDWEAIIVDDDSSDTTATIAAHFAIQDSRFRVIHQSHQGVSAVRNTGINLARYGSRSLGIR